MAPVHIQSRDYRDLLDIIDKLRSLGVNQYVPLPEIIVCGDQSAGKSSVLEAISGLSFPTKDNLCTRFATELVLRRHSQRDIKISIIPHHSRTESEKTRLAAFTATVDPINPDLAPVVEAAKAAMGLVDEVGKNAKRFSNDVLRIELSGPEQQHLTLVDLPGLFKAGNSEQSEDEAPIVRRLVKEYMKRPRSIILAVVSASNDFANQEVTQIARTLDPRGVRTMGLITKPDKLDRGSDSERAFVKLAENRDVVLQLGWHVLKNRSYDMREASSAERDADEEAFFQQGVWSAVNPAHMGVAMLRPRLSNVLKNQILAQLPKMLQDIDRLLAECNGKLAKLGEPRSTPREQRQYLGRLSLKFLHLMRSTVDGAYTDMAFFGNALQEEGCHKRLRAEVQKALMVFAKTMHDEGHTQTVIETAEEQRRVKAVGGRYVYRDAFIDDVKAMMANSRGLELPGMFSPLVVGELFRQQSVPWARLAQECVDGVLASAYRSIVAILDYTAVPETAEKILQGRVNPAMDALKTELTAKLRELVAPHQEGHPITYNHYLTENVQKTRSARMRRELEESLKVFYDVGDLAYATNKGRDVPSLVAAIAAATEPDMERLASSDAIDYMEAYYKVALKSFVDSVCVLAIERCLLQKLPELFTPDMVYDLSEEEIHFLAGETDEVIKERQFLADKKETLEKGQLELRRLDKHRTLKAGAGPGMELAKKMNSLQFGGDDEAETKNEDDEEDEDEGDYDQDEQNSTGEEEEEEEDREYYEEEEEEL